MSLAPEECSRRLLKAPNKLKLTGNENKGASETRSPVGTADGSGSKCQRASQLIDKPVDEVANVQYRIGDDHQGTPLIQVEVTGPPVLTGLTKHVFQFRNRYRWVVL